MPSIGESIYGYPTVDAFQKLAIRELRNLTPDQTRIVVGMIDHHKVTSYIQLEGIAEENWRRRDTRGEGFEDQETFDSCCAEDQESWGIYEAVREKSIEIREKAEACARMSPL